MTLRHDEDSPFESDGPDRIDALAPDGDLADMVKFANAFGLEANMILTLSGQVIGGLLVGGHKYYQDLASAIGGRDGAENSAADSIAVLLRHYSADYEGWGSVDGDLDEKLSPLPPVAFIHLLNAYVLDSNRPIPIGPWRGRLSHVVGWTFGELTYVEEDE